MGPDYLFVYGTLRRGAGAEMERFLSASAQFIGPAHCRGRIYRAGWYPGLIESDEPGDRVLGDVFLLRDAGAIFDRLDPYEGCGRDDLEPTVFVRRRAAVTLLDGGEIIMAWVYLYNRSTEGLEPIATGDFLKA